MTLKLVRKDNTSFLILWEVKPTGEGYAAMLAYAHTGLRKGIILFDDDKKYLLMTGIKKGVHVPQVTAIETGKATRVKVFQIKGVA